MEFVVSALQVFHYGIVIYIVTGWLAPNPFWLKVYLTFLPLMVLQWLLNENACIVDNLESLIRFGTWRSPENPSEGAFIETTLRNWTGIDVPSIAVDILSYGVVVLLWIIAFQRLRGQRMGAGLIERAP